MDIFDKRNISPMLIAEAGDAFDSPDYIYELKLDGIRCLAYLDAKETDLRNKRNLRVSRIYPELKDINKQVKKRCILDGEVFVLNKNGKPDFYEVQRRALMSNSFKIELAAKSLPVSFTAFDIIYLGDKQVTDLPLIDRKELLQRTLIENERLSISRYIENNGIALYNLTEQQELEGIVAKRKGSKYYFGKNTKDWIKIKYLKDDDYVVCGYKLKDKGLASVVLGQYRDDQLINKGHVSIGTSSADFKTILKQQKMDIPPFSEVSKEDSDAEWIAQTVVCIVDYMHMPGSDSLRQPRFKGLRNDKSPKDCTEKASI